MVMGLGDSLVQTLSVGVFSLSLTKRRVTLPGKGGSRLRRWASLLRNRGGIRLGWAERVRLTPTQVGLSWASSLCSRAVCRRRCLVSCLL